MRNNLNKFIKDERGDTYVWLMIIVGIFLFGFVYGMLDPLMTIMHTIGVDSSIPSEQLAMEDNIWQYLPLVVLLMFAVWGFTETQRRRVV